MTGAPVLESPRLYLRQMCHADFDAVAEMLEDPAVMYAWEHTFSPADITAWIDRRLQGYRLHGCDYLLAVEKSTNRVVGQIGLLLETIEDWQAWGVGWILSKASQHQGYATEGAAACLSHGFRVRKEPLIIADIRPSNAPSMAVAQRLGMTAGPVYTKLVHGKEMPHIVYSITREDWMRQALSPN